MTTVQKFSELGPTLAKLRKLKRISQEDVAKASEVNRSNLSKIENGKATITWNTASRISSALGYKLTASLVPIPPAPPPTPERVNNV